MTRRWLDAGEVGGAGAVQGGGAHAVDTLCWPGALRALPLVPEVSAAERIILYTGDRSFHASGAAEVLAEVLADHTGLTRLQALPAHATLHDLQEMIGRLRCRSHSLLLAIGGGRVVDQAKALRVLAAQSASPRAILAGEAPVRRRGAPLLAVPTMPATGREVTSFAALDAGGARLALDHPYVRPDVALVDARLSASLPVPLATRSGVQVMGRAVDAIWSVDGNDASRAHGRKAFKRSLEGLTTIALDGEPDTRARVALAEAALHVGYASNRSRGALLHALAWPLANATGLPSADALAMLLPQVLRLNGRHRALPGSAQRNAEAVDASLQSIIEPLGGRTVEAAAIRLTALLEALALPTSCSRRCLSDEVLTRVVDEVNLARLRNNPVQPSREALLELLRRLR